MSIMTKVAEQIQSGSLHFDQDLPYPNIYWATVRHSQFGEFNSYFAGEFTGAAKAKVLRWCREAHGFAAHRSVSTLHLRRLKLGDLVQNPGAFDIARRHAVDAAESDIVAALDKLPGWIAEKAGIGRIDVKPAASLWERMTSELERYDQQRHA